MRSRTNRLSSTTEKALTPTVASVAQSSAAGLALVVCQCVPQILIGKLDRQSVLRDGCKDDLAVAFEALVGVIARQSVLRYGCQDDLAVAFEALV
eukprot:CAMPEP_0198649150 /NCGR_PEP_ID=MMETSP1467-20131203/4043_1 /TAXON_ID=1462469 /ORGANISM="unid. sp., Strain CCMP2135" /LENGTH=94 /DNA_ID=CAMNT_0044384911 /DNA_START=301 /DNA_END=582 /DNA_ORIENTATION=+